MSKDSSSPTRRSVLATSAAASVVAAAANTASGQQTTNLFLVEELDEVSTTRKLAESDRNALRAVADWTKTFVVRPHRDLGRAGPVCPFVPVPWNTRPFGLLLSGVLAGARQMSSSS